ncbi:hypothetical protein TNCV_3476561 [Trichonephila clavipes]|nr:hypothetical protein TNCV_3476561 [Trichonephila clavipes]
MSVYGVCRPVNLFKSARDRERGVMTVPRVPNCGIGRDVSDQVGVREKRQRVRQFEGPATSHHMFRQLDTFLRDELFPNQDSLIQRVRDFFDQCDADFCHLHRIFSLKTRWTKCISADSGYRS